jgi:hypothetical protein
MKMVPKTLISKWIETEHYYSIGGPGEWHPTKAPDAEIIEFKNDNVFYSSLNNKLNRHQIITRHWKNNSKIEIV